MRSKPRTQTQALNLSSDVGDSWTFTAVERHTKLVIAWHFGRRYQSDTNEFCRKLANATTGRFLQLLPQAFVAVY